MSKVLITGATGAIGHAVCLAFESHTQEMYLHYHQNETRAKDLSSQLSCDHVLIQADLSEADGLKTLINQLPSAPDTVIYCAGYSKPALLQEMSIEEIERTMTVHLTNPIKLTQALLPAMLQARKGSIMMVSSIWGLEGASMESVYASAKSGLNGFVKSMAKEVGRSGIRVNAVAPGAIQSEMLSIYSEEDLALLAEDIPAGRLGKASEVADAIFFLTSEKATYINGQIISVNGGWHC